MPFFARPTRIRLSCWRREFTSSMTVLDHPDTPLGSHVREAAQFLAFRVWVDCLLPSPPESDELTTNDAEGGIATPSVVGSEDPPLIFINSEGKPLDESRARKYQGQPRHHLARGAVPAPVP